MLLFKKMGIEKNRMLFFDITSNFFATFFRFCCLKRSCYSLIIPIKFKVLPNLILSYSVGICTNCTREEIIALSRDHRGRIYPDELFGGFIPVWAIVKFSLAGNFFKNYTNFVSS